MYGYLLESLGIFTRESMKSRKCLDGHNQFTNRWVKTVFQYHMSNENIIIMRAEVIPSQRPNEKRPYPMGCSFWDIRKGHGCPLHLHGRVSMLHIIIAVKPEHL